MNRIPIPLHPTAYGLAHACPEWPSILAELTEALRRGQVPFNVRCVARANIRALGLTALQTSVLLGLIDEAMGWEVAA